MKASELVPTEDQEQRTVVDWLSRNGILFCHVPNGGARRRVEAAIFAGLGVRSGVPDILVFDPPPIDPSSIRGAAIEMKRQGRQTEPNGGVSEDQAWWIRQLAFRGWRTEVSYGADEAIHFLDQLGYGRRRWSHGHARRLST